MQRVHRTAALFISHNLGLIRRVCERVAVMYSGQIVEQGPVEDLFTAPRHPYTRELLACAPSLDADKRTHRLHAIGGRVARLTAAPSACTFAPRCAQRQKGLCDASNPVLEPVEPAHGTTCAAFATGSPRNQ